MKPALADWKPSAGRAEDGPLGGLNPAHPAYVTVGDEILGLLIRHAGLIAGRRIVDVGCGTGRLAAAISRSGLHVDYLGIDANAVYVEHCRTSCPTMEFLHVDVGHPEFNPVGLANTADVAAQVESSGADLVCCLALFNHLWQDEVDQLLLAAGSGLRRRGVLFATCFLHDQSDRGERSIDFAHAFGEDLALDPKRPLANVAHAESAVRSACLSAGLVIREPLRYGHWRGGRAALTGHDVLLAYRP